MIAKLFAGLLLASFTVQSSFGQTPNPQVRVGNYAVELRIPAGGIYSGEETDIEFRVLDATTDDPVQGMAGVPNCTVSALVTMPAMQGMPEVKPPIHREGVPGDYGVTTYFPHGGEYRITLTVTPPNEPAFKVAFTVDVKDERPKSGKAGPKPFTLEIKPEASRVAGQPTKLVMTIVDTKTKQLVRDFDEAHTMKFHLLLASSDFQWFLHEHPEQQADGTWAVEVAFPAGGNYFVYADVAPAGKGSIILGNRVTVRGPAPTWPQSWNLNKGPSSDGGLVGTLSGFDQEIPIGRMITVKVTVKDSSGKLVSDLQPWLGAWGHLMIFSQDGQTVVHSHPQEGTEAEHRVKQGEIQFNARFPKAGKYRAFAQFQRDGQVKTLAFTLEVKP